jgi:hypothetical protein
MQGYKRGMGPRTVLLVQRLHWVDICRLRRSYICLPAINIRASAFRVLWDQQENKDIRHPLMGASLKRRQSRNADYLAKPAEVAHEKRTKTLTTFLSR